MQEIIKIFIMLVDIFLITTIKKDEQNLHKPIFAKKEIQQYLQFDTFMN